MLQLQAVPPKDLTSWAGISERRSVADARGGRAGLFMGGLAARLAPSHRATDSPLRIHRLFTIDSPIRCGSRRPSSRCSIHCKKTCARLRPCSSGSLAARHHTKSSPTCRLATNRSGTKRQGGRQSDVVGLTLPMTNPHADAVQDRASSRQSRASRGEMPLVDASRSASAALNHWSRQTHSLAEDRFVILSSTFAIFRRSRRRGRAGPTGCLGVWS